MSRFHHNRILPSEKFGKRTADADGLRATAAPASRRTVDSLTGPSAILSLAKRNEEATRWIVVALLAALCVVVIAVVGQVSIGGVPLP
jgi:hypothetical protein